MVLIICFIKFELKGNINCINLSVLLKQVKQGFTPVLTECIIIKMYFYESIYANEQYFHVSKYSSKLG